MHALLQGKILQQTRLASPFLLRTVDPPIESIHKSQLVGFERLGKRIIFEFQNDLFLVFHLMVTGRFHWRKPGCKIPAKIGLAAFDFSNGTLLLTEAGTKKRASLHLIKGHSNLVARYDLAGLEIFDAALE